jgi:hypothetical protein
MTDSQYWEKNKDWFLNRLNDTRDIASLIRLAFLEGRIAQLKDEMRAEDERKQFLTRREKE